jgi:hypothetical protein
LINVHASVCIVWAVCFVWAKLFSRAFPCDYDVIKRLFPFFKHAEGQNL